MKKIPTLFERQFEHHRVVGITDKVTPGLEWVLAGEGTATEKIDGSCCAVINGEFYKRYDAKKGKKPPVGAIPCQAEPDPITGHFPHWVKCDRAASGDQWFWAAHDYASRTADGPLEDATYEAIGPHFQGNPYGLESDIIERHGARTIFADLSSFEKIKKYLAEHKVEGIVFWKDGVPECKIKRSDFGFEW